MILREIAERQSFIIESTCPVRHLQQDDSEVAEFNIPTKLGYLPAVLLCDLSVSSTSIALHINGIPCYSADVAGEAGDAIAIGILNGRRIDRVIASGVAP